MGLLQVLYVNKERAPGFSASRLAEALEFDGVEVEAGLEEMVTSGLVERVDEGYTISEKGYFSVSQRETSYCPHL
jgi:hypothetical protein